MNVLRRKWQGLPRGVVVCITALVIYVPLLFIVVQSFLSAPFFPLKSWSLKPSPLFFTDPDFYLALRSGFILAFGTRMIIAIPLGGIFGVSDGAHRFTRPADHWVLIHGTDLHLADGAGLWLRGGRRAGRLLSQWAQQLIGFCAVEYLLDVQHCGHRRLNSRSACLSLYLFGALARSAPTWKRRRAPSAPRRCR